MKVIIKGQIKEVSEGYARNYLFPRGLAAPATSQNIEKLNQVVSQKNKLEEEKQQKEKSIFDSINNSAYEVKAKTGENGKLFGAITAYTVYQSTGIKKEYIKLDKPIKEIGTYDVPIKVGKFQGKIVLKVSS